MIVELAPHGNGGRTSKSVMDATVDVAMGATVNATVDKTVAGSLGAVVDKTFDGTVDWALSIAV